MQLIYQEPDKPKTSYTMDEDGGGVDKKQKICKISFRIISQNGGASEILFVSFR
jgi:hypothetical protein